MPSNFPEGRPIPTINFIGGAPAIAQVTTWTFAGTWIAGETITVTGGNQAYTFTTTQTVIANIIDELFAALNALDESVYPILMEQTYARSSTNKLMATANTAGKSFTLTVSTNSSMGTIGSATAVTANSGPYSLSTAANYSSGTLPVNADTLIFNLPTPVLYNLDALSAVTLASLVIDTGFTGSDNNGRAVQLGLPQINTDATSYPEYRPKYMQVGATAATINCGSGLIRLNYGSVQTATNVIATGTSTETNATALVVIGTHASNVLTLQGGNVGSAIFGGDASTWLTTTMDGGAVLLFGIGTVTWTTINCNSGTLILNSNGTTLNYGTSETAPTVVGQLATAITTLNGRNGLYVHNSSGTLGTVTLSGNAVVDCSQDVRSFTLTNPVQEYGDTSSFNDPYKRCSLAIVMNQSGESGGRNGWGKAITLTRT